jgi:GNAT superfamily N-acetyltransferase
MGWEVTSRIVTFDDLLPLARIAKRERLSFKPTQNTVWFGLYFDGDLGGCGGAIWGDKAQTWMRLKSALILPEWRGTGGYGVLVRARTEYAFDHGASFVRTITRNPQVFERWEWSLVRGTRNIYQLDRV